VLAPNHTNKKKQAGTSQKKTCGTVKGGGRGLGKKWTRPEVGDRKIKGWQTEKALEGPSTEMCKTEDKNP